VKQRRHRERDLQRNPRNERAYLFTRKNIPIAAPNISSAVMPTTMRIRTGSKGDLVSTWGRWFWDSHTG
jgi:hypothetical protein